MRIPTTNTYHIRFSRCLPQGFFFTNLVFSFAGMVEIVRKINLTRTLDIMANLFPNEYNFHPQSWFLPQQYPEFVDAARRILVCKVLFRTDQKRVSFYVSKPQSSVLIL